MRHAVAVLALLAAIPVFADARTEKRRLIAEVLEVLDTRYLIRASLDTMLATMRHAAGDEQVPTIEEVPEEYRAQIELQRKREEESLNKFRERLLMRVDHVRYADEIYAPLFDDRFTADELRELSAFLKTKTGQKLVSAIPELAGGVAKGRQMLMANAQQAAEELYKEELAAMPWRGTMQDIRSIAAAVEAYATDTNQYPAVAFEGLEAAIAPTYILEMPELDAWGTPFFYISNGTSYRIVSAGADRHFDWSSRNIGTDMQSRAVENDSADIVFQDGTFIQYPVEAADLR